MSGILDHRRVLLAGESWVTHGLHAKGAVSYTTAAYEEGGTQLIKALRTAAADVVYLPNHLAVEEFPRTVAEIERFDAVILSDIAADTLLLDRACFVDGQRSANRLEALAQFVEQGGALLMVGGYMSFSGFEGKAHYGLTPLARVLPVTVMGGDDRMETPEGVAPCVRSPTHPVLNGLSTEWPYFLGYNKLTPKPAAEVLLEYRADPFLVVQEIGRGRAGAFASDCSPHWGSPAFLAWPSYGTFWAQLLAWLIGDKLPSRGGISA